jgi:hypothetical protein
MKEKGWMKTMKSRGLEDHMRRMREMKSMVDDTPPRSAMKSNRREMMRVSWFLFFDIIFLILDSVDIMMPLNMTIN